jgi:hypothetical protein
VKIPTRCHRGTTLAAYKYRFAIVWRFGMEKLAKLAHKQEGKMGYILLWLLGVPIPVLFVIFLLRGCT